MDSYAGGNRKLSDLLHRAMERISIPGLQALAILAMDWTDVSVARVILLVRPGPDDKTHLPLPPSRLETARRVGAASCRSSSAQLLTAVWETKRPPSRKSRMLDVGLKSSTARQARRACLVFSFTPKVLSSNPALIVQTAVPCHGRLERY